MITGINGRLEKERLPGDFDTHMAYKRIMSKHRVTYLNKIGFRDGRTWKKVAKRPKLFKQEKDTVESHICLRFKDENLSIYKRIHSKQTFAVLSKTNSEVSVRNNWAPQLNPICTIFDKAKWVVGHKWLCQLSHFCPQAPCWETTEMIAIEVVIRCHVVWVVGVAELWKLNEVKIPSGLVLRIICWQSFLYRRPLLYIWLIVCLELTI